MEQATREAPFPSGALKAPQKQAHRLTVAPAWVSGLGATCRCRLSVAPDAAGYCGEPGPVPPGSSMMDSRPHHSNGLKEEV